MATETLQSPPDNDGAGKPGEGEGGETPMSPHYEHLYDQGEISAHEAIENSQRPVLPRRTDIDERVDPPGKDPEPERGLKAQGQDPPKASEAKPPGRYRKPPRATTWRQKAAGDSGHDRKPFPYGTQED